MNLNEGRGQYNLHMMYSHDWSRYHVKFDSYRFTGFWDNYGWWRTDRHTDRLLGLVYVNLFKVLSLWLYKETNIFQAILIQFSLPVLCLNKVIFSLSFTKQNYFVFNLTPLFPCYNDEVTISIDCAFWIETVSLSRMRSSVLREIVISFLRE